jgi:peptidoglycan/xylan/chitin deacetylase (PgdA/CDA1 family)
MAGTITLSMEIELGWGVHDLPADNRYVALSEERTAEEKALERVVEACEQYDVPITFPVVGHLLMDSCEGHLDAPHDEGWFTSDPETNIRQDPLFYAPDLIQRIIDTPINHEIGTHTFSHVLCDEVRRETIEWELQRVDRAHRQFGIDPPQSMVAPRHREISRDILREHDIRAIRIPVSTDRPQTKMSRFLKTLVRSHPHTSPSSSDGVVEVPCTRYMSLSSEYLPAGQRSPHPAFSTIPSKLRRQLHKKYLLNGIESAIRTDSHTHFHTHLFNIANDEQWEPVSKFFKELGDRKQEGELEVLTMKELSSRIL